MQRKILFFIFAVFIFLCSCENTPDLPLKKGFGPITAGDDPSPHICAAYETVESIPVDQTDFPVRLYFGSCINPPVKVDFVRVKITNSNGNSKLIRDIPYGEFASGYRCQIIFDPSDPYVYQVTFHHSELLTVPVSLLEEASGYVNFEIFGQTKAADGSMILGEGTGISLYYTKTEESIAFSAKKINDEYEGKPLKKAVFRKRMQKIS